MKKTLSLAAVALGLVLVSANAMAEDATKPAAGAPDKMHHGEKHKDKKYDRFAKADKNGDGFLTQDEMLAAQKAKTEKMFTKLDSNKDGKLSKAEMEAGKKDMREKMKSRMEERKSDKAEAPAADKAAE
ncbi:MAG TPA: EF-hand domain-containing protein [Alphaproteobacteria bacterium]|nr:EF-hand domain-containing protein [Alphaproteobacteria bacterium]